MGSRGPQPGFKRARQQGGDIPAPSVPLDAAPARRLTYEERNNPKYLSGAVLRDFAHSRGVPRSSMESMTDEKVRAEVNFLISRQYDDAEA